MKITNENYYSPEVSEEYLSYHNFIGYVSRGGLVGCEARSEAIRRGEWSEPTTKAMLVGSYVDSYFEGTLDEFRKEHKEIFLKDGVTLKAEFRQAEVMINRCLRDEFFMKTMDGEKQKIITFEWEGVQWRAKLDVYKPGKFIVDLKTTSDLHKAWRVGQNEYMSVPQYWGYDLQLALYQKGIEILTGEKLPCYLSFVTKEDYPELEVVGLTDEELREGLEFIKENLPQVMMVRRGEVEPIRCEKCDYCKSTKKLKAPIGVWDLIDD